MKDNQINNLINLEEAATKLAELLIQSLEEQALKKKKRSKIKSKEKKDK